MLLTEIAAQFENASTLDGDGSRPLERRQGLAFPASVIPRFETLSLKATDKHDSQDLCVSVIGGVDEQHANMIGERVHDHAHVCEVAKLGSGEGLTWGLASAGSAVTR